MTERPTSVPAKEAEDREARAESSAPSARKDDDDDRQDSGDLPVFDEKTIYTGPLLKRVREVKGISLKQIYERTRINVPSLMAVEEERFADLPNARIYVRGFVRCLAQEIGLDPEAVSKSYVPRWERWFDGQKVKGKSYLR